jgi:hypothetical protein
MTEELEQLLKNLKLRPASGNPSALQRARPTASVVGGMRCEAGQEIVLLSIRSASPAKAGVYRSVARACAHWQSIAILGKSEAADPWIPAFAGKARVAVDDFSSRSGYLPSLCAIPPYAYYGSFIEGFDTRDLKEAKALLEELAA